MWKAWSLSSLPMIPERFGIKLIDQEHITKQFAIIEGLMQQAERIVNCGDAGQEGELIQRWEPEGPAGLPATLHGWTLASHR